MTNIGSASKVTVRRNNSVIYLTNNTYHRISFRGNITNKINSTTKPTIGNTISLSTTLSHGHVAIPILLYKILIDAFF